jgi:transcriptional regulator with XRE-family HTH domain
MITQKDLLESPTYWLTSIQIEVFNLLCTYMEEYNLTQEQVAEQLKVLPSYVSQILNGHFNFTISKLVELALLIGKAPVIRFESMDEKTREATAHHTIVKPSRKSKASLRI